MNFEKAFQAIKEQKMVTRKKWGVRPIKINRHYAQYQILGEEEQHSVEVPPTFNMENGYTYFVSLADIRAEDWEIVN